jgi:hypothetical protein
MNIQLLLKVEIVEQDWTSIAKQRFGNYIPTAKYTPVKSVPRINTRFRGNEY